MISSRIVRLLSLLLALSLSAPALAQEEPAEVPIPVPTVIPVGFLLAWKPTILSVRIDSGVGSRFGSDKLQLLRALGRYTTTFLDEHLLGRVEVEGGQFQSDTQGQNLGTNGYDVTLRLLGGTATRISQGFIITASAGFITRYQRGRAVGGAPNLGIFGATSNVELEYRLSPSITTSFYLEGGLAPFPYNARENLGVLSDASEFRARLQISLQVTQSVAVDVGYDFTRWHASFSESGVLDNGTLDKALLIEDREHAMTIGIRWKP